MMGIGRRTKNIGKKVIYYFTHLYGTISRKYYFEDNVRVYDYFLESENEPRKNNYLNHLKVYSFALQFAIGKKCLDVGCGSGYGSNFLAKNGAKIVQGIDASKKSIKYSEKHYAGDNIKFDEMYLPNLKFENDSYDFCICAEVLEHIKEYDKHEETIVELKRVTKNKGLILIATPNSELAGDHGFFFSELNSLMKRHFLNYIFFENLLIPSTENNELLWYNRLEKGEIGTIYSKNINLKETVDGDKYKNKIKESNTSNPLFALFRKIDLSKLHNTHSFLIVAQNNK